MGNHDQSVELWFEGNLDYLPLYLYSPAGCSEMCVTAGGTPPPNSKTSIGRRASRWDHNKQTDKQIRNKKLERVLLQEHRRAKSEISRRRTRTTSQGRRLLPGETTTKIETNKNKKTTKTTTTKQHRLRTTSRGGRLLPGETTTKIETNKNKKTTKTTTTKQHRLRTTSRGGRLLPVSCNF